VATLTMGSDGVFSGPAGNQILASTSRPRGLPPLGPFAVRLVWVFWLCCGRFSGRESGPSLEPAAGQGNPQS
jgi:hypothetical protein